MVGGSDRLDAEQQAIEEADSGTAATPPTARPIIAIAAPSPRIMRRIVAALCAERMRIPSCSSAG